MSNIKWTKQRATLCSENSFNAFSKSLTKIFNDGGRYQLHNPHIKISWLYPSVHQTTLQLHLAVYIITILLSWNMGISSGKRVYTITYTWSCKTASYVLLVIWPYKAFSEPNDFNNMAPHTIMNPPQIINSWQQASFVFLYPDVGNMEKAYCINFSITQGSRFLGHLATILYGVCLSLSVRFDMWTLFLFANTICCHDFWHSWPWNIQ